MSSQNEQVLGSTSTVVSREAARALGNLAANLEHGKAILKEGALSLFMALIRSNDHGVQRMAAMALCNLSSNVRLILRVIGKQNVLASDCISSDDDLLKESVKQGACIDEYTNGTTLSIHH